MADAEGDDVGPIVVPEAPSLDWQLDPAVVAEAEKHKGEANELFKGASGIAARERSSHPLSHPRPALACL
jgi:hypothetical protein